jgi:PAS domain S-box-containing protein
MNWPDKSKYELKKELRKLQQEYDSLKISYEKDIKERKPAEEELRKRADEFKVIASSTPDHILLQDNELRYALVINPQLGLTEQDMLGKTDYDFLSKEEADKLTGVKRHVIETGEPQHLMTSLISKDGKPEFFDGTYIPRFDAHGNADGLIGYFRNVTEGKLVEDSLRESEEKLKEAQTMGRIGSWEFDIENQKILWSDQTYRLYDRNPAHGPPTTEEEAVYYSPEQVKTLHKYVHRAIEEGKDFEYDLEAKLPGGRVVYFSGKMHPVKNEYGQVTRLIGTVQDITERKQVEKALKINEALFRELYDNMKSGSVIFTVINDGSKGSDYIIKKFNRNGLKMERKTLEEVVGKRLIDIRPTIDSYGLIPVMKKVWETGESAILPTKLYIDERYANYYENYVFKLPSGEVVTLYDDVTESKRAEETLRLEKENFRHSLDDSPLGVRIASIEGNTIYANKTILDFYGYDSLGELQNTPLKSRYTPESYVEAQKRKHQRERGDFSTTDYEISIVRKNKEIRYLRVFRKEVLWNDIRQFQIICNDITERRRVEQALLESDEKFRTIFGSVGCGLIYMTISGNIIDVNPAFEKIVGYKKEFLVGKNVMRLAHRFLPGSDFLPLIKAAADTFKGKNVNSFPFRLNGRYLSGSSFFNQEKNRIISVINDLTGQSEDEIKIKEMKESLEKLNQYLNEARENERALISREIHDQLGQSMTALKLDLNWMHKYINTSPEAMAKLEGMIELVSNTIKDVQRISSDLRPGILDDLGLAAAIEWYSSEFEKRSGIKCSLKFDDSIFGDSQKNLLLFRVLQEALTNIIRHANASSVTIKLHQTQKGTTLVIQDNGIGITREKVESTKSLGLIGMRERIRQFGGKVNISSGKEQGTKLIVFIPN